MKYFFSFATVLFSSFLALSFLVSSDLLRSADLWITIQLQKFIPNILTTFFSLFSVVGSAEFAGLILLIILVLYPKLNKINVLLMFALFTLIEIVGKSIITQIAPPIEFLKTNIHLFLPASSVVPKELFSYPSGHSGRTAFISGILLIAIYKSSMRKELKLIFAFSILIFDFTMFISRVYLGEHWTTDVVGGLILGFSLAILSPFLASYFKKTRV